jgi:hypothetical protein
MKNSTLIVGVSALVFLGVGAYIYFKGKKSSLKDSLEEASTDSTVKTSKSNVVNSSVGLPTNATASIDETKTNNYIIAKKISEEIKDLENRIKDLAINFNKKYPKSYMEMDMYQSMAKTRAQKTEVTLPKMVMTRDMQKKSKEANALGYKILPYGLIEKM